MDFFIGGKGFFNFSFELFQKYEVWNSENHSPVNNTYGMCIENVYVYMMVSEN